MNGRAPRRPAQGNTSVQVAVGPDKVSGTNLPRLARDRGENKDGRNLFTFSPTSDRTTSTSQGAHQWSLFCAGPRSMSLLRVFATASAQIL